MRSPLGSTYFILMSLILLLDRRYLSCVITWLKFGDHYQWVWFWLCIFVFTESRSFSVSIICESIGKYLADIRHTTIQPFPLATIVKLQNHIQNYRASIEFNIALYKIKCNKWKRDTGKLFYLMTVFTRYVQFHIKFIKINYCNGNSKNKEYVF